MTDEKQPGAEPETPKQRPEAEAGADASISASAAVEDLMPGLAEAVAAEDAASAAVSERIEALEAERDELKEKLLRALAETENVRRRADRDKRDAEAYAGTKLARDLLSVHDNLKRALGAADEALKSEHAAFFEGVELTARELLNAFAKHKIAPVTPEKGEKFDPNRHQAMFEAPVPGAPAGAVIEVMQEGFVIGDRLLRPALVGVAKGEAEAVATEAGPTAG